MLYMSCLMLSYDVLMIDLYIYIFVSGYCFCFVFVNMEKGSCYLFLWSTAIRRRGRGTGGKLIVSYLIILMNVFICAYYCLLSYF